MSITVSFKANNANHAVGLLNLLALDDQYVTHESLSELAHVLGNLNDEVLFGNDESDERLTALGDLQHQLNRALSRVGNAIDRIQRIRREEEEESQDAE